MNTELEAYARKLIAYKLELITDTQFLVFKRMYCFNDLEATREEACILIPTNKLDWALTQLDNTINKNK